MPHLASDESVLELSCLIRGHITSLFCLIPCVMYILFKVSPSYSIVFTMGYKNLHTSLPDTSLTPPHAFQLYYLPCLSLTDHLGRPFLQSLWPCYWPPCDISPKDSYMTYSLACLFTCLLTYSIKGTLP